MFSYVYGPRTVVRTNSNETVGTGRFIKTNIREEENKYIFDVNLPGFKKEDIKLSIEDGNFKISVKRDVENNDKLVRRERFYGDASRSFKVGNVLKDEIKASLNNGILTVEIPQDVESDKEKYIEIE